MMKTAIRHLGSLFVVLLLSVTLAYSIPSTINYQGVLTNNTGAPLNHDVSVTFRLYDDATTGTEAWSETQTVTVSNGVYSAQLGQSAPLDGVDFTVGYWLEVEVGGEILTPRQALNSVPYAMHAQYADGVAANSTIDLNVATESALEATVKGTNTGNGYGVYGWSGSNYGVYGHSSAATGVLGYSNDLSGVVGLNGSTGNEGRLGTEVYGVYGHTSNSNSYAGYFVGKTVVSGGSFELNNPGGENWLSFLRGTNQNAGFAFKEEGEPDTQWIFPYFRGWQSDNLIVRDEMANIDVMTFETDSGNVGIGTNAPEGLLHISAGTAGDAQVVIEADTDNNNENDQPSILFKQDGGLVTGRIGFAGGVDNLLIQSTNNTEFYNGDGGARKLVGSLDTDGNLHVIGNITHGLKTGYLWVPAGEFIKTSANGISVTEQFPTRIDTSSGWPKFTAAVHLPNNAVITNFLAYFDTLDNDNYIYVALKNFEFSQQIDQSMTYVNNNDGLSGYRYVSTGVIEDPFVDNPHKEYYIELTIFHEGDDSLCRFRGARITYDYGEE